MDFFTRASENKLKKRKGRNQTAVRVETNYMYNRNCTTAHSVCLLCACADMYIMREELWYMVGRVWWYMVGEEWWYMVGGSGGTWWGRSGGTW